VDAAYGGFAILTQYGARQFAGIERADSVTLDPHKWLFVPFECGGLIVRDPARLKSAFHIMPEYLQDVAGQEQVNFADYGEQLTRYSRALKVWLSVRYFGVAAIRQAIERGMDIARHFERLVLAEPAQSTPLLYFGEIHELPDGDLLWTEWGSSQLVRLERRTGTIRVVAGSPAFVDAGADGPSRDVPIGASVDFVIDSEGRVVLAGARDGLIRRVDLVRGTVETLAGRRRAAVPRP
jgi:hypothetical protein